ncbi:MAG: hypothetical protein IMZ59_05395 [Actinobacteria bacterium]|nr:hypothetical protein [Actinomycetota bacterium]
MEILNIFSLEGKKAVITGGAGILSSVIAKGLGFYYCQRVRDRLELRLLYVKLLMLLLKDFSSLNKIAICS